MSWWCSEQCGPLSRLYAVMIPSAPPSRTASSNGTSVELAQRAGVDHRVDALALELGVVAGEVLHRGDDALRLHAADERRRGLPREQRVLGVALEVAAAERRTVEVDRRRQQHAAGLGERLLAEHHPDPLDQLGIPGGAECGAARRAHRGLAAEAEERGPPRAVGPVGHPDGRDADPLDGHQGPEVGPGGERRLLLDGHGRDQRGDVSAHAAERNAPLPTTKVASVDRDIHRQVTQPRGEVGQTARR